MIMEGGRKMNFLSNKINKDDLRPGDHIYSWRLTYLYSHHGIYVGDGMVIHFTRGGGQEIGTGTALECLIFSSVPSHSSDSSCPNCGEQSRVKGVISSCLDCFLSGGELYLFQYGVPQAFFLARVRGGTCTLARADPVEDVLHRARFLLQNGFGSYNLFKNNCEDFAIYCKTGLLVTAKDIVGRSGQATAIFAAAHAVGSTPNFTVLAAVGVYCVNRLLFDTGVRDDVTKIPVENLVAQIGNLE